MSWQSELDEMERRAELARQMGGPDSVAFHHGRGKLTVRERIDLLTDPGEFQETGVLAGNPQWDGNELSGLMPANSVVGVARINGRKVAVQGDDFTIRGGSADGMIGTKGGWAQRHAYMNRIPYVRLLDATGGSVKHFEQLGRTYVVGPEVGGGTGVDDLLWHMPVVNVVLGSVAGAPAVIAADGHFNVMVKGTSQLFVGGPPVVKASRGLEISKEELGGEDVHVYGNGVVQNLAETEADAMQQARRFLSYLPQNVWEMPPRIEPTDDPERREEKLVSIIPRNIRRIYNARRILDWVLDKDSFFEIQPHWGKSRITGLARVDGYPVGVMINNPRGERRLSEQEHLREDHSHDPALRHVPSTADLLLRRAGLLRRPGRRTLRHHSHRGAADADQPTLANAVSRLHYAPGLRRRGRTPVPSRQCALPSLCLALGPLGFDAHRGRRDGRVSARDPRSSRSRGETHRDRSPGSTSSAHRCAPPTPSASKT